MAGNLVELARKFVDLSDQLETVRGEIARAVLNCGGGKPEAHPTGAQRSGVKRSQSSHPNAIAAKEAEAQIIEVLRSSPGLGTAAVAKATSSKTNTTAQRLQRMREKGAIIGGGADGWRSAEASA